MLEVKVILIDNLEIDKISLAPVKNNPSGFGKTAYLLYDGCPFYIGLLSTSFPYGAVSKKSNLQDKSGTKYEKEFWSLMCTLSNEYLEKIKALDQHIVKSAARNPAFSSILSVTSEGNGTDRPLSDYYTPILKSEIVSSEPQNTLKVNLQSDTNTGFLCEFYQNDTVRPYIDINSDRDHEHFIKKCILPGSEGALLFGMKLWLNSSGFGVNLRAEELKIEKTGSTEVCCLLDN